MVNLVKAIPLSGSRSRAALVEGLKKAGAPLLGERHPFHQLPLPLEKSRLLNLESVPLTVLLQSRRPSLQFTTPPLLSSMDTPPGSNPQNNAMPPPILPTLNQGHDSGPSSNIADAAMPPPLSHPNTEPQPDPFSTRDLLEALAAPASAPLNGPAGTIQPRKGLPHKPKGPAHKPKGPTHKVQTPSGARHPAAANRQELARHAACIAATRTARAARTATAPPRRTAPAARTAAPLPPMDPVQVAYAAGLHFGYRSGLLAATTTAPGNYPMAMAPLPPPGPYLVALAGETPQALFRRQQEASARYQASCEAAMRAALGHVPEVYPAVQGGLGNPTPVWPMDVPPQMELHRVPLGDARLGGNAHRRPRGSFPVGVQPPLGAPELSEGRVSRGPRAAPYPAPNDVQKGLIIYHTLQQASSRIAARRPSGSGERSTPSRKNLHVRFE